ncbi:hypothetical protein [Nocardia abscessus]|uniref:hypothetical protein n=1 Tax=Nocardia abscessus TaxID=120957 RepID=UPI002456B4D8|nr:hypothetical protein [Nocardia abscessus]
MDQWRAYLMHPDVTIVAESGYTVDFDEFWYDTAARPADVGGMHRMRPRWPYSEIRSERCWRDADGHPFAAYEFADTQKAQGTRHAP